MLSIYHDLAEDVKTDLLGRPIYRRLPLSLAEKFLILLTFLVNVAHWVYLFAKTNHLPRFIPDDYADDDDDDVEEKFGKNWKIFLVPAAAALVSIGISYICKRPHELNYFVRITPLNAKHQYRYVRTFLRFVDLLISIDLFCVSILMIYGVRHPEKAREFFPIVVLAPIILIFLGMAVYYRCSKRKQ